MELIKIIKKHIIKIILLFILFCLPLTISGQDSSNAPIHGGIYIKLTKDFYEALKGDGSGGSKTYSNDPSSAYLKEISISTRFMVETNLQIIKNQERIIQLLENLKENKGK